MYVCRSCHPWALGDRPAAGLVGYVIRAFCVPFETEVLLYFLPFAFVLCVGFYSLPEGIFIWLSAVMVVKAFLFETILFF